MAAPGSFIPLTLGTQAEAEKSTVFRAHVIKNAADAPFQPVASLLPAPTCSSPAAGPKLELERNGRTITRIRITCACGQILELDCRYPTAS
ncbi:MAG: hypothetical protein N3J91_03455 [Verrucomicrobiae bacterium]|nr:hypothetical protein [Verrucomicrobiae bacterium]